MVKLGPPLIVSACGRWVAVGTVRSEGILANKFLKERLAEHGYFELPHTPCLFMHKTRPVWFILVVDDFGIKYIGRQHADHLIGVLKEFTR